MRRLTFILLVAIICSGCGVFRKVFKSKEYSKLETSSKSTKDSAGMIIDKSITTIKERIDTTVIVPGQVVSQDTYLNMDSLVNGLTAIKNDLIDVTLQLNPVTGILSVIAKIKPQRVSVKMAREIVKKNDITQQSYQLELRENALKQSSGFSTVEKDPINLWCLIVIAVTFAIVCVLVYWCKR